jgi:hypothetical protein
MFRDRSRESLNDRMRKTIAGFDTAEIALEGQTDLIQDSLNLISNTNAKSASDCMLAGILASKVAPILVRDFERGVAELELVGLFSVLGRLANITLSLQDPDLKEFKEQEHAISPALRLGLWGCLHNYYELQSNRNGTRGSALKEVESARDLVQALVGTSAPLKEALVYRDNTEIELTIGILSDTALKAADTFRRDGLWLRADWALGLMKPYLKDLRPDKWRSWIKESELLCSDFEAQATTDFEYGLGLSLWGDLQNSCVNLGPDYRAEIVRCCAGGLRCAKKLEDRFCLETAKAISSSLKF